MSWPLSVGTKLFRTVKTKGAEGFCKDNRAIKQQRKLCQQKQSVVHGGDVPRCTCSSGLYAAFKEGKTFYSPYMYFQKCTPGAGKWSETRQDQQVVEKARSKPALGCSRAVSVSLSAPRVLPADPS